MNKIYVKYGFPVSLIVMMICLAFNTDVAFLVQWNESYHLHLDPKACYYISLIYNSIVTCIISYYFYLKMEESPVFDAVHPGYFLLSFLLSIPLICLAFIGPAAHGVIALTIVASLFWTLAKLYQVVAEYYKL